jgi:DNA-binding transcriptional LysR family regulator
MRMTVDVGVEILGPLIAAFADQHPGLSVEFDLSSRALDQTLIVARALAVPRPGACDSRGSPDVGKG